MVPVKKDTLNHEYQPFADHGTMSCSLCCSLMMHGRNNGKKLMAARIVKHAFDIINLTTDSNPIQILVDAIINGGPREDATRIGSAGVVRRCGSDIALALLCACV
jgi:ribosomal protein S7